MLEAVKQLNTQIPPIEFEWGGKHYCAPKLCKVKNTTCLPDGTLIQVDSWYDSSPSQICEMHQIKKLARSADYGDILAQEL